MVSPKTKFLDWDPTASNNTDINGIGILGTNAVNNFDDALRTTMAQLRSGVDGEVAYVTKSGNYTAVADDNNAFLRFSAAATLTLTAAATLGTNWHILVVANGGDVTIDPNSSETIDGKTTLTVRDGACCLVVCDGTNFKTNLLADQRVPRGEINGLTLSNNASDATNDIDVATGECASDGTIPYLMILASALTKRLDAAWAVGTNQGGLDTGSIANTTYHIWLIQRSDTGVVDALFSASATAPTMPTNYDRKRRVGSIVRASAAIRAFRQYGDVFKWVSPVQDRSSSSALAAALFTLSVPTGIIVRPLINMILSLTAVNSEAVNSLADATGGTSNMIGVQRVLTGTAGFNTHATDIPPTYYSNTSAQVLFSVGIISGSIASNLLFTAGWIDTRGRD